MQTIPSQLATLVFIPPALKATSTRSREKVFPRDSRFNPPITVGDLPLNFACAPSIWPQKESLPNCFGIPETGVTSQLPEDRSVLTKPNNV